MVLILVYHIINRWERKVAAVRITKIEFAAMGVTLVLLSLMIGFFLGRNTVQTTVIHATPEASSDLMPSEAPESVVVSVEQSMVQEESVITGPLDLNLATAEQLEALPGIGSVLAQRILSYRAEIGGFHTVEELKNVEGIGDKKFEAIQNLIEVGNVYENSGG